MSEIVGFERYKSLPRYLRVLASNLWVGEVMAQSSVKNCHQLIASLKALPGRKHRSIEEENSKFWYAKFKNEPVKRLDKVQDIEGYFNNSSHVLPHPLWNLLNFPLLVETELLKIALYLSQDVKDIFLTPNASSENRERYPFLYARSDFNQRQNLCLSNNIDGLTALLILYCLAKKYPECQPEINQMSFNLFCRLFAIRFTPKLAWRFYKLIQIRFFFPSKEQMLSKESKSSKASQLDALNNPPQIFGDIGNELFLIDYLMGLKTLAEKAVKNELIDDTASNKHSFLYYAIQGNLAEIYIELEDFGKVGSLNHHSHLSPLLSKIDLR